jgi:hypothetical protein
MNHCLLTLNLPLALEDEVLDVLLAHPDWCDGYSVVHTEAFGRDVALPSVMEQIRGRARRCDLRLSLPRERVDLVLAALKQACPNPSIAYRVIAVEAHGSLV